MFTPQQQRKARRAINLQQTSFAKGYMSTLSDSRMPLDALSDMTNMILEQDAVPRPRPSLIPYGVQPVGKVIGKGKFIKLVSGQPERWEISLQVVATVARVYIRKDGTAWTEVAGTYTYNNTLWSMFTQSNNRVYISNGQDAMSYYDINLGTIVVYNALATPATPTATPTGLTGTAYTARYRVSANNAVGETAASTASSNAISKTRDTWDGGTTQYITVTWAAVTGATSYNLYYGEAAGNEYYLTTVNGTSFTDDGRISLNSFRLYPQGDSTTGPKVKYLYNKNAQLFGVADKDNPSYLWYSGSGTFSGDFSPFNGGGFVAIDYGGDTVPVAVRSFRDGKGTPVMTVLSRGSAGEGKVHHVSFNTTSVGDTVIIFPEVYEANGQSGTVSPLGVVEANNSLFYPTGTAFKSTGTKENIVNILSTDSVSQALEGDIPRLNLDAMDSAVGLEYENRIYWALPVGSTMNNEIWILDLSRNGAWILRWNIAAKFMYLYEDNDGVTHHCVLTYDDRILEFSRTVMTTDDGVPFKTRVASGGVVFDKGGISMASIQTIRFKLLRPAGEISVNTYGLGQDGDISTAGGDSFTLNISNAAYGSMMYSSETKLYRYSDTIGAIDYTSVGVAVIEAEVDDIVNQETWEVTTESSGCDYLLSSVNMVGKEIDGLYLGD
jgi:hypothetical protein